MSSFVGVLKGPRNRQARWVDFDDSYMTMNIKFMEFVLWAFKDLYLKKALRIGAGDQCKAWWLWEEGGRVELRRGVAARQEPEHMSHVLKTRVDEG